MCYCNLAFEFTLPNVCVCARACARACVHACVDICEYLDMCTRIYSVFHVTDMVLGRRQRAWMRV